ncbi:glycosyltransferase family 2 protein [Chryseolinea lacunae]|uniref:Glycosyltransferase n=1 Tax=Chryseolinea lacunae TaxID=2801331 RepID=A0ABS1KXS0_9BACT|nr:glycosyltransferase [Chryseolinea lacunae]MBL0744027.1 glycosyltransferase [Chryseolinea lacunae]
MSTRKSPLLSIITPTYNRAASLPAMLDSVLRQEYEDWEVVVADDGSTDNTPEILAPYLNDRRIRYFQKPNSGVSDTRNFAVEKSVGEYLFFLDSDDLLREGTLSAFGKSIEQTHADVLFGSCRMVKDGVEKIKEPSDLGQIFNHVKGLFLAGAFCIKKDVFMTVGGYNTTLKFSENYELGIRVCQHTVNYAVVRHVTADYFIHSQKRTSNSFENKVHSNLYILNTYDAILKTDPRYLSTILSQTGYLYRALGNRGMARSYFLKSFRVNPFNGRNLYRFLTSFT